MSATHGRHAHTGNAWFLALLPPVLLLVAFVVASSLAPSDFGDLTPEWAEARLIPWAFLATEILALLALTIVMRFEKLQLHSIGWRVPHGSTLLNELLLGLLFGVAIGVLYVYLRIPALGWIRDIVGDVALPFDPSRGARALPTVSFIAGVILAPFVEESIYRGFALTRFRSRHGTVAAVAITSMTFALLSWPSGIWSVVATALVLALPLALLTRWRTTVWPAYAAHLMVAVAIVWSS